MSTDVADKECSAPKPEDVSLQNRFEAFRQKRREDIKHAQELKRLQALRANSKTQAEKDALRARFLEKALSYQGIPYSRGYHPDESDPFHDAPLYLDCCGLVRRVLRDLKDDFGFEVGRWNQAYQFDTLPVQLSEEEMKPGDLVFISGTYFKEGRKQQIHNMVHVEIWMGDGQKTLGARNQRGVVEIHDCYQFVSKGYGDMKYHFRSLETWLDGVCVSHCGEHEWRGKSDYVPGKYSVFAADLPQEADEGAGDVYDVEN